MPSSERLYHSKDTACAVSDVTSSTSSMQAMNSGSSFDGMHQYWFLWGLISFFLEPWRWHLSRQARLARPWTCRHAASVSTCHILLGQAGRPTGWFSILPCRQLYDWHCRNWRFAWWWGRRQARLTRMCRWHFSPLSYSYHACWHIVHMCIAFRDSCPDRVELCTCI